VHAVHDLIIRGATIVDGTGAPARTGDVAVAGGRIVEVGDRIDGPARREVDAEGLVLTPGFVDVHTHYDGQVTWDPDLTPSSWHGVTTVVMGNCGVGFAPVRPGGQEFLIELMEGVEDIPGTALAEGIDWRWESFGEYLDALDSTDRVIDVAAQVPHAALRAYVMGERAHEPAEADEIEAMSRLTEQALRDGAIGVTTSRTFIHRSKHGVVPGTYAPSDEVLALGDAIARAGHGVFQLISDQPGGEEERAWIVEVARRTGGTVTYSMAQTPPNADGYLDLLADAEKLQADDCNPKSMPVGRVGT
jgi:N-acyl-D-amino-acid deacylase